MSEKRTLIEEGTEFRGVLSSRHPVEVTGTVEGDLSGPMLQVNETGVVSGKIKVGELRSSGEIAGEIEADEVHLSGRVRDKAVVRAKFMEVDTAPADGRSGVLFGECDIEVGEMPDKRAVIAAAAGARAGSPAPEATAEAPVVTQDIPAEASGGRKGRKHGGERTAER